MTATDAAPLLVAREVGIATLTLNRPDQMNTLSEALLVALQDALDTLAADPDLRCVVVAARGRAFCVGHDLREMQALSDEDALRGLFQRCSGVMQALRALPVPVIAAVQGAAVAAGCQLVAACDLAIAGHAARFAVSGINLGLFCSTPAVALSRAIAPRAALDLLLTGRFLDAEAALAQGLVSRVVPDDGLAAAAQAYAGEIAAKDADAVRIGKRMFYAQQGLPLADAYRYAGEAMACNMMGPGAQEGVRAFLDRGRSR